MHQPDLVRGIHRLGHLLDNRDRTRRGQRALGQDGLQVAALDQSHGHKQLSVDLAEFVDRHHVALVEPGRRAGLPAEPLLKGRIVGEIRGQHLQRHYSVDGGVVSLPHLTRATAAQQRHQALATERGAFHMSLPANCGSGHDKPEPVVWRNYVSRLCQQIPIEA